MKKVQRYFLDYQFSKNEKDLKTKSEKSFKIILNDKKNYEINKFFYKQIGKDHFWRDRLVWTDKQWAEYVFDEKGHDGFQIIFCERMFINYKRVTN